MSVRYFDQATPPPQARENDRWRDTETGRGFRWRDGKGWVRFVDRRAKDRWSKAELEILRTWFPIEGAEGVAARLPRRKVSAVESRARAQRLRGPLPSWGMRLAIKGADLEEAIRLHQVERLGFAPIGRRFGCCEAAASNAVLVTLARRSGARPAERNDLGYITPAGRERIREALRKGWKGVASVARLAVTSGTVTNERRRYNAELKARGKRPLPPPGGGERYSGARIAPATKREVERLYLAGRATLKVSEATGVSHTHCLRIRTKLIRRLRRQGECLPACDRAGKRLSYPDTIVRIPAAQLQRLRRLLLDGTPVARAADLLGIGRSMAYRERDLLKAELDGRGETLPPPRYLGRGAVSARWLPVGRNWIIQYRKLTAAHGEQEARQIITEAIAAIAAIPRAIGRAIEEDRRRRRLTFEEQLDRVRNGAGLTRVIPMPGRALADVTFGGVASGQLA